MPLFGNKFSPKKSIPRRSTSLSNLNLDASERQEEFGLDYGPIKLKLGANEITFDKGHWVAGIFHLALLQPRARPRPTPLHGLKEDKIARLEGLSGGNPRELLHAKKQNQQLQEENNLLKLKVELLLDMLAQNTANMYLQENEIDQLKKLSKKK